MRTVYLFEVALQWWPDVSRTIEILGDQTLHDLHNAIGKAFNWDDEHQYSFYVGVGRGVTRRRLDDATEYVHPFAADMSDAPAASDVTISELQLRRSTKIEYLYDYGASWWHTVKFLGTEERPSDRRIKFPRIVKKEGKAPPQYSTY